MKKKSHIIILGGGQTAAYAAKEIRKIDSSSDLTIISDEKTLPYERPPLSKDCLLNKMSFEECLFFSQDFYDENKIKIIKNETINSVNFEEKKLNSNNKISYSYDKLLIATGAKNKKLKIDGLNTKDDNIIYLRNIEESAKIKDKIKLSNKIIIIGGGFIGLEIASSAVQMNKNVIVLERTNQLMGRVIPVEIAKLIQDTHEKKGNTIRLNIIIKKINKVKNSFEIILESGEVLISDLIIVGVGSQANTDIFQGTPLKIDNGVVTNEFSQTSIQDVYAAGDVSNFYHPFYSSYMRLESFKHAQNHGINAGKNIIGKKTSYNEIPWMWSDQFNLNLQLTGICVDYETIAQRGETVENGIIYFFLKNRKIIGACGLGTGGKIGRDIRLAGKLSERKIKVTKEMLSNQNQKLNKI
jgi:3-phenylpropionate/trans-cinnamate dioxygenase ferredoxin reductase subunit